MKIIIHFFFIIICFKLRYFRMTAEGQLGRHSDKLKDVFINQDQGSRLLSEEEMMEQNLMTRAQLSRLYHWLGLSRKTFLQQYSYIYLLWNMYCSQRFSLSFINWGYTHACFLKEITGNWLILIMTFMWAIWRRKKSNLNSSQFNYVSPYLANMTGSLLFLLSSIEWIIKPNLRHMY